MSSRVETGSGMEQASREPTPRRMQRGEMEDPNGNKRVSPKVAGKSPSPHSRTDESSPRVAGRSPLLSPALVALGSSRLDPIPEHDHHGEHSVCQTSTLSPLREPPPLVLGPTFSNGSISSLESGSLSSVVGLPPPIIMEEPGDEISLHDTDVDTIGPGGGSDTTVERREPVTPEEVLETKTKGKRRLSAVSAGLDKIRNMMGKGKANAADKPVVADLGTGMISRSSSRRSSTSSVGPGLPVGEWKSASPVLSAENAREGSRGMLMRKDENVLKLTKTEPLSSPIPSSSSSSILNRPTTREHVRTPTPPHISITTSTLDVDIDSSSTPAPDPFLKSSISDFEPGFVPAPSPSPSLTYVAPTESDSLSDLTPTVSRTPTCVTTPRNPATLLAVNPMSPGLLPATLSSQQSRRSSLTSPAVLKTRSFDQEAQNLMLNALQRGSGQHEHKHGLSLSRSSTKDSAMTGSSKPGVGGALAALGFKTAAAVGATESIKKSNINVLHPSEPVGAASSAPGVSLTAATPMMEQEDSAANSGSGYFGSRRQKGSSRSSRSVNKEEKYRRSLSPFFKGRRSLSRGNASEKRDPSPPVGALSDAGESDGESVVSSSNRYRPQATAFSLSRRRDKNDSDDEDEGDQGSDDGDFETDTEYDDDALSHEVVGPDGWVEDVFDPQTEENTKANAVYYEGDAAGLGGEGVLEDEDGHEIEVEVDALGEGEYPWHGLVITLKLSFPGPNVVIPPEPMFAQPTMRRPATPPVTQGHVGLAGIVHKEKKKPSPLPLQTSRPEFGRNRCTVKLTQGNPDAALEESGNRLRSYVVLSDLSAEAGYAIEWCIG